ncbi:MAG: GGDEF domain-containing protein [Aquabacterium sp.]|nr:MAG: GGDEF domain-containing protein [Aquabacterium sp.]
MATAWKRSWSAAASGPVALALIDVEFFKTVDDTHGHLAGDEVLCGLVREAQAGLAEADLLARWGGEEFLVLFPGGCPTVRRSGRSPAWGRTSPASRCTAGCRRAATCACWPAHDAAGTARPGGTNPRSTGGRAQSVTPAAAPASVCAARRRSPDICKCPADHPAGFPNGW